MTEQAAIYQKNNDVPLSLDGFKGLPCALPVTDERYLPPTPEQVAQLINLAGWSQNDAAKLVGVSWDTKRGSSTIRKWKSAKGEKEHRPIPYSAWRLMLVLADVVSTRASLAAILKNKPDC